MSVDAKYDGETQLVHLITSLKAIMFKAVWHTHCHTQLIGEERNKQNQSP